MEYGNGYFTLIITAVVLFLKKKSGLCVAPFILFKKKEIFVVQD